MSAASRRGLLRPLNIPPRQKDVEFGKPPSSVIGGTLSPDLSPNTPPTFPRGADSPLCPRITKIGRYLLLEILETRGSIQVYHAVHATTEEHVVCKVRKHQYFIYFLLKTFISIW